MHASITISLFVHIRFKKIDCKERAKQNYQTLLKAQISMLDYFIASPRPIENGKYARAHAVQSSTYRHAQRHQHLPGERAQNQAQRSNGKVKHCLFGMRKAGRAPEYD